MTTISQTFPGTKSKIHCSLENQTKNETRSTYSVNSSNFIYRDTNWREAGGNPSEFQMTRVNAFGAGLQFLRIFNTLADNASATYGKIILADENDGGAAGTYDAVRLGKHLVKFDLEIESGDLGSNMHLAHSSGFYLNARDTQPYDFDSPAVAPTAQTRITHDGHHEHLVELFDDGSAPGPSLFFSARKDSKFTVKITNLEVQHIC
tara:strand:- start:405 stop:1022 length:618 start_codon:yes stop_codon:yes gene_type:complete